MSISQSGEPYDLLRELDELSIEEHQLDRHVVHWQNSTIPGDFLFRTRRFENEPPVTIYYEILPVPEDLAELPHISSLRRFVRMYSHSFPGGVTGTEHVANFEGHLSREAFSNARAVGWPTLE
jgi:hypothetical protein